MENMAQPNFGEECRAELAKREKVVKNDYRCVLSFVGFRVDGAGSVLIVVMGFL
jgi:hypothetical protein